MTTKTTSMEGRSDSFRLDHHAVVQGGIKTTWRWVGVLGRPSGRFAFDPPVPWIILIMEGPFPMPNIVLALIHKQILNHNVLHRVRFVAPNDFCDKTNKEHKVLRDQGTDLGPISGK